MRNAVSFGLALCLSLWLGGLVALVIFVSSLFAFDRALAVGAAPRLFHVFERYQIGLAVATTVLIAGWQALRGSRLKVAAFVLTLIADVLAALQIAWVTPTINATRGVDPPKFDRFHHLATQNYSAITLLILAAGVLFLLGLRRESRVSAAPGKAPATAAA